MKSERGLQCFCPDKSDWPQVHRAVADGFGVITLGEDLGARDHLRPPSRRLALSDTVTPDNAIVGGAFAYEFQMSLPGGACLPVAGLGGLSISPVAQGRGGLPLLMNSHLQQSLDAGDAASVLMASESGLYQRYGYGVATEMAEWHLNTREYQLRDEIKPSLSIRLIHDRGHAAGLLEQIYEGAVTARAGGIHRSPEWWPLVLNDDSGSWFGSGPEFVAVVFDNNDHPCGYALYKLRGQPATETGHGRVHQQCVVSELVALDIDTEVALFTYLSRLAMVRELVWSVAPTDPVVRHYMTDPRQLWQHARTDMMWLRPLDLPALFSAIEYSQDGAVVIDYCDPQFESLCQVWRVTVQQGRAALEKCSRDVLKNEDAVALDSAALGEVILGSRRVVELARVGKIVGSENAVRRFDRLLTFDQVPFNLNKF